MVGSGDAEGVVQVLSVGEFSFLFDAAEDGVLFEALLLGFCEV